MGNIKRGYMIKKLFNLCDISVQGIIIKQIICLIYMIIYTVLSIIFPSFIGKIIDSGIETQSEYLLISVMEMLLVGIFMVIFQYLQNIGFYKLGQIIIVKIKDCVYKKIFSVNLHFHQEHKKGDLFTIIQSDISAIEQLITSTISSLLVNIFMTIGILFYIFNQDILIGIITLGLTLSLMIVQKKVGKIIEDNMGKLRYKIGDFSAFIMETLSNIINIQLTGREQFVQEKFSSNNKNVSKQSINQMKLISYSGIIGLVFNVVGMTVVLGIGALRVNSGKISIGVLFNLLIYIQRVYGPILIVCNSYVSIKNIKPNIKKIIEVLENEETIIQGNYFLKGDVNGDIEFKNVSFAYGAKKIFNNLNIHIKPHDIVAIVGKNGSGKSTLTYMLGKICKPQSGSILLDGIHIDEYNVTYLRSQVGFMPQNSLILSGTLRECLVPPNKIISDNELCDYMKMFDIKVNKFTEGLNTKLNENHQNLSGGEAQKLALIRLLLEEKPIYILDEPTSALDLEAENEICSIIQKFFSGHTVIIITHRKRIREICTKTIELNV